jgi:hypothetical protein
MQTIIGNDFLQKNRPFLVCELRHGLRISLILMKSSLENRNSGEIYGLTHEPHSYVRVVAYHVGCHGSLGFLSIYYLVLFVSMAATNG